MFKAFQAAAEPGDYVEAMPLEGQEARRGIYFEKCGKNILLRTAEGEFFCQNPRTIPDSEIPREELSDVLELRRQRQRTLEIGLM